MQTDSIAEQLFFTTLRIDTVDQAGNQGAGTGFFFAHKKGDVTYPFLVSNKHVVDGMRNGRLTFHKRSGDKPVVGQGFPAEISDWPTAWFGHPDPSVDISVLAFAPLEAQIKAKTGTDLFYCCVSTETIPAQDQLEKLDAIEQVTFIGYPNGIWDSKNSLPVARRGATASPIQVDFEGTPRFLIDASVFGGSSGSPVFIFNQGMYTDKSGGTAIGSRLLFVGVVAAVFFRTHLNEIVAVPIPTQTRPMASQQEMIDLGIVFKARTVTETIEAFLETHGAA